MAPDFKALLNAPQQIFVPFDSEVRMKATLHQNSGTAKRNRLVNLFANLIDRPHVRIGRSRPAIKRAERTNNITNVCVVDIPVDDVGDDVLGMPSLPDLISSGARYCDTLQTNGSTSTPKTTTSKWVLRRLLSILS